MLFAAIFYAFCLLFIWLAWIFAASTSAPVQLLGLLFAWAALAEAVTGSLYLAASLFKINPGPLFKRPDGTTRFAPRLFTWIYLFFEHWGWRRYRERGKEPLFEEVVPGLFQGARPVGEDWPALEKAGIAAVLDLVAEFEAPAEIRANPEVDYVCIPLLDGAAPTFTELAKGAEFVNAARAAGRTVLVHCTFGHGRSSTFTAAALIASGEAGDVDRAFELLKKLKRRIWLTREQKRLLARFAGQHKEKR